MAHCCLLCSPSITHCKYEEFPLIGCHFSNSQLLILTGRKTLSIYLLHLYHYKWWLINKKFFEIHLCLKNQTKLDLFNYYFSKSIKIHGKNEMPYKKYVKYTSASGEASWKSQFLDLFFHSGKRLGMSCFSAQKEVKSYSELFSFSWFWSIVLLLSMV